MIRYLHVSNGKVKKGNKSDYSKPSGGGLLCVFLIEPTGAEVSRVASDFGLDRRPFEKYDKENHSVRYSLDPFVFVIVDYFVEDGKIGYAHLLFVIKGNVLVIVTSRGSKFYDGLFDSICGQIGSDKVKKHNVGSVLHAFLQEDVEENYDVLEKTEEEIIEIEEKVADYEGAQKTKVKTILKLKRKLFMMSRRFWASTKIIFLLKAGFTNVKLDEKTSKLLVDVHDTFLHQIDMATAQKEMLSDVMSIYSTSINNRLAVVSNELNVIMKKMTAIALILLLPTLIASIYGMNFQHIPFTGYAYGFYIAVAGMGVLTAVLVYFFSRRRWF